jgi:hypothetical protein
MKPAKATMIIALLFMAINTNAQDKSVEKLRQDAGRTIAKDALDTSSKIWKRGGVVGLNLAQTSLSNWAAGGDDFSLSLNTLANLHAFYKKGKSSWDNTLDFNLGYIKTTSLGSRKNDDRIDLLSKYGHAISSKWNLSGLFNFRTQLFKGYSYTSTGKTLSSNFLSPAYVLLGAGLDYKPNDQFSFFISPATGRVTIVKDDSLAARGMYGVDSGKHHHVEFGAFLSVNFLKDLNKVVSYKGRFDLFSNYRQNPQNVDLFMSNVFAAKLSKWLTANWNFDLIYDDDTKLFGKNQRSPAMQIKSLIGVGVMVKFG